MNVVENTRIFCENLDYRGVIYKITKCEEHMCVLECQVNLIEYMSDLKSITLTIFIFENQIIFYSVLLRNLAYSKKIEILPMVNEMNCDYSDYKFLLQEGNEGYNLEMRTYIDIQYISDAKLWTDILMSYASNIDLVFTEYAKGLTMFS